MSERVQARRSQRNRVPGGAGTQGHSHRAGRGVQRQEGEHGGVGADPGARAHVEAAGLGNEIHTYSGCYAPRTVARSATAPPSQHAYGAAIDINAPENPYGSTPTMDPKIVRIFQRWGFMWGGDFLTPDGMHFEYGEPPGQSPP